MKLGWPLPKRIELLDSLDDSSKDGSERILFQGRYENRDVYRIPIELPKYRLANGRTQSAQEEYLVDNPKVAAELFTRDLESNEAQKVQHQLLTDLADKEHLFEYFQNNQQTESLYLTHEGFVVNGNRRLCAWRILLDEDPKKYSHFSSIRIIRLPVADEKAIDELEAKLQVITDIKAEYDWVSEALMLKKRRDTHKYTMKELVALYEMKEREINVVLDMFDYANKYLTNVGREKHYSDVIGDEYAFKQLVKTRKNIDLEEKKDLLEACAYTIIEKPGPDRVYTTIKQIGEHIDKIIGTLQKGEFVSEDDEEVDSEIIELLGKSTSDELGSLVEAVSRKDFKETLRSTILDVVRTEEMIKSEKKKQNYVLSMTKKAHTHLEEAFNGTSLEKVKKTGVKEQLDAIEELVIKLRAWLLKDG
ncbi:MAG: hypothetical protein FVQ85_21705 [Planctomycetes bacterium]|nr:hypothetical protein [Planctomycetota bacterium]